MGRLKARLANSPEDAEFHSHLADAERALTKAMQVCRRASSKEGSRRRGNEILRELGRMVAALQSIGHLTPPEQEDPDLLPEDALSRRFWRRKQAGGSQGMTQNEKRIAARKKRQQERQQERKQERKQERNRVSEPRYNWRDEEV